MSMVVRAEQKVSRPSRHCGASTYKSYAGDRRRARVPVPAALALFEPARLTVRSGKARGNCGLGRKGRKERGWRRKGSCPSRIEAVRRWGGEVHVGWHTTRSDSPSACRCRYQKGARAQAPHATFPPRPCFRPAATRVPSSAGGAICAAAAACLLLAAGHEIERLARGCGARKLPV